ncbi:MAG: hypothetical protein QNJ72_40130 [Pleurocapsa sp. MO_226.B13]|nr:hypothetical protein [Pleurocapsa sp. MO_226.B13]
MARKKSNPLKQGLKAARNINIVDNPATEEVETTVDESKSEQKASDTQYEKSPKPSVDQKNSTNLTQKNNTVKRGRGRPPGKKSDPKTTQAGGYVDEDLYLDVQITLTQLKRKFTKRSEVNVSTLMSALFSYFQSLSKSEQEAFLRQYSDIDND